MIVSDEPTRVDNLVQMFLAGQSGSLLKHDDLPDVLLSAGADAKDDCAVFEISGALTLVVGSDYVRGPKFVLYEIGLLSDFDIGYYLVVANLSDIAAMGALPIGVLTVVRYPGGLNDADFCQIMAGIHQACTDHGTLNIGGDIGNAERVVLSGSALGICRKGAVLRRKGAQSGDVLCTTGPCGALGAAVAYFPVRERNGWSLAKDLECSLIESWRKPRARIAEGRILSMLGSCTSCQDTSDGLRATIDQLNAASGVGFDVFADSLPVVPAVEEVARLVGTEPVTLSMSASSDFQLAFTVRPGAIAECIEAFRKSGLALHVIGVATDSDSPNRIIDRHGVASPLPGIAWRHQGGDISRLVLNRAESSASMP